MPGSARPKKPLKKAGHVIITDLHQPWYVKHFLGARRIVESEEG